MNMYMQSRFLHYLPNYLYRLHTLSLKALIWSGLGDFFKGRFEQRFLHLFTAISFFTKRAQEISVQDNPKNLFKYDQLSISKSWNKIEFRHQLNSLISVLKSCMVTPLFLICWKNHCSRGRLAMTSSPVLASQRKLKYRDC